MPHRLIAILLAAMLAAPAGAGEDVDEFDTSLFDFSGYGTLGVVHSSEDRADFTSSVFKPGGAGHSGAWSSDVDSRIGAQVTANFTPQFSATVQAISEQRYDNTYTPRVEWANLKYQLSPDASIRVGRTVFSSFFFSDSRKVGYALPWVRPPVGLYSLVPINSSDGVDASYALHWGDVVHTVLANYGRTNSPMPNGGRAEARRQWALTDTIQSGAATVYVSYHEAHLTIGPLHDLFDTFRHFGPQGNAIADEYDVKDTRLTFFSLGGIYDPGEGFLMGEWGTTDLHSVLGKRTGWYVSGGHRWGKFTPYLTYGGVKADSRRSDPGLDVTLLPPFLAGPAIGLNAALNSILRSIPVQKTVSVGTRWDFMKNAALKVQYDHTELGAGSPGTLSNLQSDFLPGGRVNLFSATFDFVF